MSMFYLVLSSGRSVVEHEKLLSSILIDIHYYKQKLIICERKATKM